MPHSTSHPVLPKSRILVTGACGSVGSTLVKRLLDDGHTVCAFDNSEDGLFQLDQSEAHRNEQLRVFLGDIRDLGRLTQAMERVNYVFHCAGLKHVYLCEYNPFEAVQTNVAGSNNIIKAALDTGVERVVFTSSDKAVNPTSTMGASKLLAERLFIAANSHAGEHRTRFSVVRFGNVLNSNGSVLQIFQRQINEGRPLTITSTEMTRFFLSMHQSIDLCIQAAQDMCGGEIFIKNMGACDILALARIVTGDSRKFEFVEVGCKPGEKFYEELVTDIESLRTIADGNTYVIVPEAKNFWPENIANCLSKYDGKSFINKPVRSDNHILSDELIRAMLSDAQLIV